MRAVPIVKSSNLARSLAFYTQVLDFVQLHPEETTADFLINLVNGDAHIQLSSEGHFGTPLNFFLGSASEVDGLFAKYVSRGHKPSTSPDSPVHTAPLNQTWGTREFYVDDPDGNVLRFCAHLQ